jgi:hypothetical protein
MFSIPWDPFYRCPTLAAHVWTADSVLLLFFLSVFSCFAGFGLNSFIQEAVSLRTRKELLKAVHLFGGFIWFLSILTCSPWSYIPVVAQLYSFGAEPYDNVLSSKVWKISHHLWQQGEKMHYYWLISSLIIHFWFVLGASLICLGMGRPSWFIVAIIGFKFSHLARVWAYDYKDKTASILEVCGISCLALCCIMAGLNSEPVYTTVWLILSTIERLTHLSAALKYDAAWMRSYDLWLAAIAKYHNDKNNSSTTSNGCSVDYALELESSVVQFIQSDMCE